MLRLLFLCEPVRPTRLNHSLFLNLSAYKSIRRALLTAIVKMLSGDKAGANAALAALPEGGGVGVVGVGVGVGVGWGSRRAP